MAMLIIDVLGGCVAVNLRAAIRRTPRIPSADHRAAHPGQKYSTGARSWSSRLGGGGGRTLEVPGDRARPEAITMGSSTTADASTAAAAAVIPSDTSSAHTAPGSPPTPTTGHGRSPSMSPHREHIAPPSAEGFADEPAARAALRRLLDGEAGGFDADPNRTLPEYLEAWLAEKQLTLKPTTYARYRDYVNNDLIPRPRHPAPGRPRTPTDPRASGGRVFDQDRLRPGSGGGAVGRVAHPAAACMCLSPVAC
ncbi:hypothetical protein [Streptodolium elevatio]|uniref:Integrase SAM-like N-terminal domain-containing protein n=1 Tax=Streptodolium elevatio TaxID=3157996 RepID=A0ABV3DR68_9ACTN